MHVSICKTNFQSAKQFPERCIYVAVKKATYKENQGLTGKYYFHSLYKNVGAYIREPGAVSGFGLSQFYLVYDGDSWNISDNDQEFCFLWGQGGGYFHLETEGQYNTVC